MASSTLKDIRKEVKKYIDHADEKVVKMIHAMLEVDSSASWWDAMPVKVKADLEEAMQQADTGKTMTHEQVKKKYPQWFTK